MSRKSNGYNQMYHNSVGTCYIILIISSYFFETHQHLKGKTIDNIWRSELQANENSQQYNGRVLCILMAFYVKTWQRPPAVIRYLGAKITLNVDSFLNRLL